VEQRIAQIANKQHGVVTRRQLLDADVSASGIDRRVRKGLLHREYPGVYRVGHRAPSVEAAYLAAVRACGEGAVLSGRAAAYLLGLLKAPPHEPEVTAPAKRDIEGIETRHSRRIDPRDVTTWRGIPVTTVPRTLVDLAAVLEVKELARACHEAGVRHRTTPAQVEAVLARRPTSPGAGKLREILRGDVRVTLSELEDRFLERLRDARLRHAWELERRREREAHAREDEFRRYTWGDVFDHPRQMLRELRGLLLEKRPT
jgi:Transcriptional regulator, AbiEi antitoxin